MNVTAYGLYLARAGARVTARCRDFGVDATGPILLVMGCTDGPHQLAEAVADWGERPLATDGKTGNLAGVVKLADCSLTTIAAQWPNQLLAKEASGQPTPLDANGHRTIVWADLSKPVAVQVGNPRARAS